MDELLWQEYYCLKKGGGRGRPCGQPSQLEETLLTPSTSVTVLFSAWVLPSMVTHIKPKCSGLFFRIVPAPLTSVARFTKVYMKNVNSSTNLGDTFKGQPACQDWHHSLCSYPGYSISTKGGGEKRAQKCCSLGCLQRDSALRQDTVLILRPDLIPRDSSTFLQKMSTLLVIRFPGLPWAPGISFYNRALWFFCMCFMFL